MDGFSGLLVRKLAPYYFLISMSDDELFEKLKKKDRGWPNNGFILVNIWLEDFVTKKSHRWVSVQGVLVHAWCHNTLSNIACVWGGIVFLDEKNQ